MRGLLKLGFMVAVLAAVGFGGQAVYATDYTVTVENNQGSKNQEFIFEYTNIGPGFKSDAVIRIINQADSSAMVELVDVQPVNSPVAPKPAPDNNMLPYVTLSLLRDDVVLAKGANGVYEKLIGATSCVPALQTSDLIARFELPQKIGNEAQNTSLWIRYLFKYSTSNCTVAAPPEQPNIPTPPNTGDTMLPFLVIGGLSTASLFIAIILGITLILPLIFKRRKRGKKV